MRRVPVFATIAALATCALMPAAASAAVYWGVFGGVQVANLDGTVQGPLTPAESQYSLDIGYACGVAVDGAHIYWAGNGAIGRANLDGSFPDESFISGLGYPCGVAVDGSHVYWADRSTGTIGRANLDGSAAEYGFIMGGASPCGVAVDGSHVFWANHEGASIGRANLDGTAPNQTFIPAVKAPCWIATSASHVYWTSSDGVRSAAGAIGRATLDGSAVEDAFVPDVGEPAGVAVNGAHIYWADRGARNRLDSSDPDYLTPGAVGRARLDGGDIDRRFIPTGQVNGITLDSRLLVAPQVQVQARLSDYLRFGKIRHNKRTGVVRMIVYVPAGGGFEVDSPRIGWKVYKGNPSQRVGGAFRWKLKLWPGKGRAGRKIRRRLRRRGRAPIILRVTYQQEGRLPLKGSKRLAFLRRPRRAAR
jgi:hypothetical protein